VSQKPCSEDIYVFREEKVSLTILYIACAQFEKYYMITRGWNAKNT